MTFRQESHWRGPFSWVHFFRIQFRSSPVKIFLFLLFLLPAKLPAEWRVLERHDSPVSDSKLTASEFRIASKETEAEINLVHFLAADVVLEVIPNQDGQNRGLRELIEAHGGLAGINGGYFEPNLDPVGLLISNERVLHRMQKAKLLSGIFYVRNGRPSLARTREFPGLKGIQQAIQCGPFLVDEGRPVTGLDNRRVAARTFVFCCDTKLWGFGICRSVTLEDMGDILAQTTILPGHHIIRALNFDGGSSTTFYVRRADQPIFSEGRPVVSNYLIVKPRN